MSSIIQHISVIRAYDDFISDNPTYYDIDAIRFERIQLKHALHVRVDSLGK